MSVYVSRAERFQTTWYGTPFFKQFVGYCSAVAQQLYSYKQSDMAPFSAYLCALTSYSAISCAWAKLNFTRLSAEEVEDCLKDVNYIKECLDFLEMKAESIISDYPELQEICQQIKEDIKNGHDDVFSDSAVRSSYDLLARNYDELYISSHDRSFVCTVKTPDQYLGDYQSCMSAIRKKGEQSLPVDSLYEKLWGKYLEKKKLPNHNASYKDYVDAYQFSLNFMRNYVFTKAFTPTEENIGEIFGNIYVAEILDGADKTTPRKDLDFVLEKIQENGFISNDYFENFNILANLIKPDYNIGVSINVGLKPLITTVVTDYLKKGNGLEIDLENLEMVWGQGKELLEQIGDNPVERKLKETLNTMYDIVSKGYGK